MHREILVMGATGLAQALEKRELSSVEVATAFLDRLEKIQSFFRPMADIWRKEALAQAKASDLRKERSEPLSPFDGLPVTLKENLDVKGHDSTLGIASLQGRPAKKDAVVVQQLRRAGCVFLGKSNVSQLLLYHESCNPVYGRTKNPLNPNRGPGGSSGGEAAAIAGYGSPCGLGTDIGGSIRVPAHFCGIAGIKPTVDRLSSIGLGTALKGQEFIRGQVGPLARTVDDLVTVLRILDPIKAAGLDPRVPPLPFGDPSLVDVSKCTVGYFLEDGIVTPSAAVQRAVHRAADILREAGARVIKFTPILCEELIFTYMAGLSSDGGVTVEEQLKNVPVDPNLKVLRSMARMPSFVKKLAAMGLDMKKEHLLPDMIRQVGKKTVADLWKLTLRARAIQAEIYQNWNQMGFDAVICPPHATPALTHDASKDFTLAASPSMRYNFINFPAGVVPVTCVRPNEAKRPDPKGRLETRAEEVDRASEGLPVGVQVAARPFREDVVLALMKVIEDRVKGEKDFPHFKL